MNTTEEKQSDMHKTLQLIRKMASELFRIDPERIGLRLELGVNESNDYIHASIMVSPPPELRRAEDEATLEHLPSHYFEVGPYTSMGATTKEALSGLLFILRVRTEGTIKELQKLLPSLPETIAEGE